MTKVLLDKFDSEIIWDDLGRAMNYFEYFIDDDYDEPHQDERIAFNKDLNNCKDFDEMADVLNDWYSKNEMLGHHFYTKELDY